MFLWQKDVYRQELSNFASYIVIICISMKNTVDRWIPMKNLHFDLHPMLFVLVMYVQGVAVGLDIICRLREIVEWWFMPRRWPSLQTAIKDRELDNFAPAQCSQGHKMSPYSMNILFRAPRNVTWQSCNARPAPASSGSALCRLETWLRYYAGSGSGQTRASHQPGPQHTPTTDLTTSPHTQHTLALAFYKTCFASFS